MIMAVIDDGDGGDADNADPECNGEPLLAENGGASRHGRTGYNKYTDQSPEGRPMMWSQQKFFGRSW